MPDPDAAGPVLDQARDLFGLALRLLDRARGDDPRGQWMDDILLGKAVGVAAIAAAGARIAHALYAAELAAADRRRETILTANPEDLDEILDRLGRIQAANDAALGAEGNGTAGPGG